MSRHRQLAVAMASLLVIMACDLVDPMRPGPHSDTEVFGNLVEVEADPVRTGTWTVRVRVGVPRALGRTDDARPTPNVAGGILAVVTVTADTVVTVDDGPGFLGDIEPGTEVVAIPSPGTTTMIGESEVHLEAAQLMDFASYARWRLPKLELPDGPGNPLEDVTRVNSDGVERAPIPLANGRVLYFTARLRPPVTTGGSWIGAPRDGLRTPAEGEQTFERSYRTELGVDGWSTPEAVAIPGTEEFGQVQLTWISEDELRCFVTVADHGEDPWVGVSDRLDRSGPWGDIVRFDAVGDGDAFDAVAMAGPTGKTVFATTRSGGGDLYLHDPAVGKAQPLQPEINSDGPEWGPRVGPSNELYFVRGDRQLRFRGGRVDEVRLPGPHRSILVDAAPTADGRWLFMAVPRFRPLEFDLDIEVAPLAADGSLGPPIPVDDWRPSD